MNAMSARSSRPRIDWHELHDLGFSVIPVRVGEKIPAVQWARFQTERASLGAIETWHCEGHNAGIVTGAISGIVVLDCDTPDAVVRAKELGIPESTVSVRTAKGCHVYFNHPGFPVPNKTSLLPGMDVRGDGGFVVAPGSVHPSGVLYEWINDPAWHEIAPLPEWLLDMLCGQPEAEAPSLPPIAAGRTPYGQRALESELTILRNTREGSRNDQLNRSAHALAQLAAGGQIETGEAQTALRDAALAIGLEADEIERTLASGWQAGFLAPRGPKETVALLPSRPTIISADVLLAKDFPELQWAIPGFLTEGLAILAGAPKLGKSFLSLQMAVAVATGEGKAFGIHEFVAGDVLYCALEDSERRLRDRLARIYPSGGAPKRLHFATTWCRLDQGGIEELDGWCNEHPDARLVILDTLRAIKSVSRGRGSAYDEDAAAVAPLLDLARRHPGVAFLVIHHVRKSEAADIFDMISGTHGLTGVFDALLVLARHGEGAKLAAQGRDLEPYEKAMERDRRTGGWIVKGDAVALAKTEERQELLDLLATADRPLSLAELANDVGKAKDTTRHLLKALVAEGSVSQPSHGKYFLAHSQFAQKPQFEEDEEYPF